jgi:hypothetical protein
MSKYYFFLFLIIGAVLFYIYLEDPCNKMLRTDFSAKYPGYRILGSSAEEGSPDNVHCHIHYQKPDSEQVYEAIWLYQDLGSGWRFSGIIDTHEKEQTP